MDDESLKILQREITELEQLLAVKKQEFKEAQVAGSESRNSSRNASLDIGVSALSAKVSLSSRGRFPFPQNH